MFYGPSIQAQVTRTSLTNLEWTLTDVITERTYANAILPGSVHETLLQASQIKDPYLFENAAKAQWIENKDWSYTCVPFQLKNGYETKDHVDLVLEGVDTYAEIYFNGQLIGETENYFRTYRFNVKELIRPEGNTVGVLIKSPIRSGQKKVDDSKHPLPGDAIRAVTRKPQFHYGWDWGPKLTTSGITGNLFVEQWSDFLIRNTKIETISCSNEKALLECVIELEATTKDKVDYSLMFFHGEQKQQLTGSLEVQKGVQTLVFEIEVQNPKLWWPNGSGEANLYDAHLKLKSPTSSSFDVKRFKTGIRTVELVTSPDSLGSRFSFKVNTKPIFMKGANYIPQDVFQARVTEAQTRTLLQQAKDVHMNMLRVWGGGIYETDEFYSICDSMGILVWQDFMYACAMYPGDKDFRSNIKAEAEEQVKRIGAHPCIALWCGNNEISEGWHRWGWQSGLSIKEKKAVWKSYKRVFQKALPKTVNELDDAAYWESSPMLGRGDKNHQFMGDAHYWGVWHDAEDFDSLTTKVPRFMSEFGFQSFPQPSVMRQIAKEAFWDSTSSAVQYHEKHPRGFELISTYLKREFIAPSAFEEWLYLSQIVQAEGILKGIRAQRAAQPYCMGTLYWQFNDVWPAASWSSIDSDGNWKALHYGLRRAYAPLAIWPELRNDTLGLRMINDGLPQKIEFELTCMTYFGQEIEAIHLTEKTIPSGSSFELFSGLETPKNAFWIVDWTSGEETHSLTWSPNKTKDFLLPSQRPNFKIEEDKGVYAITFRSNVYHKAIRLTAQADGIWSENYFDLIPGRMKTITFTPFEPLNEALRLEMMDIGSVQ